jgi:Na+-driven multidrug efflux pump
VTRSDFETADRLSRRRARMLPVLAIFFLAQQVSYFSGPDLGMRAVDHVKIAAWLLLSIVMLLVLVTGGFWFRPKAVRALLDDEVTLANRAAALRIGFITTMTTAIALYFVSLFEPMSGRQAIHVLMSVGIAAALVRFGMLERRALKGG